MPKRVIAPGVVLPRLRQHRTMLNKILANPDITGSRKLLAMFLATWMDLYEHPDTQKQMLDIIEGAWGEPKKVRWVDKDEAAVGASFTAVEKDSVQQLKDTFDLMLKESSDVVSEK